jgi:hypothetical protein
MMEIATREEYYRYSVVRRSMTIITGFFPFVGNLVRTGLPTLLLALVYFFSFNSPVLSLPGVVSASYKIITASLMLTGLLAIHRKSLSVILTAVLTVDNKIVRYDDNLPFSIGRASGSWLFGY